MSKFSIDRELALVAVGAQIVGPRYFHLAYRRENRLGTQLPVASGLATAASQPALVLRRGGKLQQLGQCGGSGPMQGRTHRHFGGFQIQMACFAAALEQDAEQLVYFARDLLVDRRGRFFSSGERVSSTGRARQILSLTSSNSWLS